MRERWKQDRVTPAATASDGEFQRRVTLDLIGRVPTLSEVDAFAADADGDKRARLVDRLLADAAAGEHWANVMATLLFGGAPDRRIDRDDPRSYLSHAFNRDEPYDRIAHDLLTATGTVRDNGAGAFIADRARAGGGAEAVTGAAARIFLGLSIQCAQCHDHPYDPRWKQIDFHHLVAYFARTRARRDRGMGSVTFALVDQARGEARMRAPGSTEEVVVPPRFLGRQVTPVPGETRRQTFARAVLASDLFGKTVVARTWTQLFGAGLVDPWDDLGAENDAKHPALLVQLEQDFRASGFDLKWLLRTFTLSAAYGRSANGPDDGGAAVRAFARARVRPLSPEQLFASLLVATGADEMARRRKGRGPRLSSGDASSSRAAMNTNFETSDGASATPDSTKRESPMVDVDMASPSMSGQETAADVLSADATTSSEAALPVDPAARLVERTLREYRFTFEDDEMADADYDGTLPQALLLWNGNFTNEAVRSNDAGVLGTILRGTREAPERIARLFLAAYARRPTAEETKLFAEALVGGDRKAWEDAFFALLTSTEMATNH